MPKGSDEFEKEWRKVVAPLLETGNDAEAAAAFAQMYVIFTNLTNGGFAHDDALRIIAYGLFHQPDRGDDE